MEAKFKRVVYLDEWIRVQVQGQLHLEAPYEFQNYALGWRIEPTPRELRLLEGNRMFGHEFLVLVLPAEDRTVIQHFTFADVIGPAFIPEVHEDPEHLLAVQCQIITATAKWSLFLETME